MTEGQRSLCAGALLHLATDMPLNPRQLPHVGRVPDCQQLPRLTVLYQMLTGHLSTASLPIIIFLYEVPLLQTLTW